MFFKKTGLFRTTIRYLRETHFIRVKIAVAAFKRRHMTGMKVISITGSSTKSTTTAILRCILEQNHKVAGNVFDNGLSTIVRTLRKAPRDSEFAVLEVAAGANPKVEEISKLVKPDIAIVLMIDIEHYSTYRTKEAVAKEKGYLVEALPTNGIAFLNSEDEHVMAMAGRTNARIVTFGRTKNSDYRAHDIRFSIVEGLRMRITGGGHDIEVAARLFGKHFYLPILAAVTCALELGTDPGAVKHAVASYPGIFTRCGMLKVPNGPVFVVDTHKAPNHSITLPMDVLGDINAPRKTIVVGQISDYRGDSNKPYTAACQHAATIADRVYTVGPWAHKARQPGDSTGCEFDRFHDIGDLAQHLKDTAIPDEIILLKSSSNIHLERVAIDFNLEVKCWKEICGRESGCMSCGLYPIPYSDQPQRTSARKRLITKLGTDKMMSFGWQDDTHTAEESV